ncbi:MAG: hypothetical protein GYA57_11910 [Myxococcales bacterium]|nr:hypothetical protein [Myxococcales bacterium]
MCKTATRFFLLVTLVLALGCNKKKDEGGPGGATTGEESTAGGAAAAELQVQGHDLASVPLQGRTIRLGDIEVEFGLPDGLRYEAMSETYHVWNEPENADGFGLQVTLTLTGDPDWEETAQAEEENPEASSNVLVAKRATENGYVRTYVAKNKSAVSVEAWVRAGDSTVKCMGTLNLENGAEFEENDATRQLEWLTTVCTGVKVR